MQRTKVEETTDAESDAASTSSFSSEPIRRRQQKKRQKKHHDCTPSTIDFPCGDGGDKEQVSDLVMKLTEAHERREKALDVETMSKQAVLQLGRDIFGDGSHLSEDNDALVYRQCTNRIDLLISTSSAMRMVGYYLRAVLAARLKRNHKTKYVRSARKLLGLKSSADITAYPAFYSFVQEHCPSVASGMMDLEAWLQEPIFLADIGWAE